MPRWSVATEAAFSPFGQPKCYPWRVTREESMFGRARILSTIAAASLATPGLAQAPAPATTAFDGTYLGVSNTFEETSTADSARTWTRYCFQPGGGPAPLMIVNGIARTGIYQGSVSPQGVLVMRDFWSHFDGRIDSQGTVRGR